MVSSSMVLVEKGRYEAIRRELGVDGRFFFLDWTFGNVLKPKKSQETGGVSAGGRPAEPRGELCLGEEEGHLFQQEECM